MSKVVLITWYVSVAVTSVIANKVVPVTYVSVAVTSVIVSLIP